MEKLDPRTASYLQLETPHAPMHIGGLYLFDGAEAGVEATYRALYEYTEARLNYWPRLRQRIVARSSDIVCNAYMR